MKPDLQISTYHLGEHPQIELPSPKFLALLSEDGIRILVSKHYDLLAQSSIKELFPQTIEGLNQAKKNSADFFIQICGGPNYFNQNRGKPMMAKRHAPHTISPDSRIVWLECYQEALSGLNMPDEVLLSFWNYLDKFSMWMINSLNKSD